MDHSPDRAPGALTRLLRRLDARLRIDHRGRSEWVWAGPLLTLAGTVALVVGAGVQSGVTVAMYLPVALVLGVVMTGMSIAYMTPMADAEPPPDDRRDGDAPVPDGTPPWYRRLHEPTAEEPAPRRKRPALRR
jgi:hypothetical protein